ncbi:unnamed protein product [Phytophthora fragariaefolia]|uniref:Unnamed protein product n=1 Tax=Phytophthora fragariaefolia TaxID=1490495 RepID=A0A9W6TN38_9STRA|nr:unnamed protein product [Phytophthora fragariaefolia]
MARRAVPGATDESATLNSLTSATIVSNTRNAVWEMGTCNLTRGRMRPSDVLADDSSVSTITTNKADGTSTASIMAKAKTQKKRCVAEKNASMAEAVGGTDEDGVGQEAWLNRLREVIPERRS